MDRAVIALWDAYTHATLDRRTFLDRLARLAGGTAAAAALLPLLEANYAHADTVAEDDARLTAQDAAFDGPSGPVKTYVAVPNDADKHPAVIVIHENRGLTPHIRDVTRRLATAGFLAMGPDLLSPLGGTPTDEDKARELIGKLDAEQTVATLGAAIGYLEAHPRSTGKVGAVGFCWGGGMVGQMATKLPALDAAVVFYGRTPDLALVPNIQAPLLLHYAGMDERINGNVPAFEAALKEAKRDYQLHMYEGADHAFHNDTAGPRFNAEAAKLAWDRTIAFFNEKLAG
jgi:carboxymethylenebutenolidase